MLGRIERKVNRGKKRVYGRCTAALLFLGDELLRALSEFVLHYETHGFPVRQDRRTVNESYFSIALVGFFYAVLVDAPDRNAGRSGIALERSFCSIELCREGLPGWSRHGKRVAHNLVSEHQCVIRNLLHFCGSPRTRDCVRAGRSCWVWHLRNGDYSCSSAAGRELSRGMV
jgi:hypothetical protein